MLGKVHQKRTYERCFLNLAKTRPKWLPFVGSLSALVGVTTALADVELVQLSLEVMQCKALECLDVDEVGGQGKACRVWRSLVTWKERGKLWSGA